MCWYTCLRNLCTLQVGIGIFTKSTAEYAKRGEDFSKVRLSKQPCTTSLQALQGAAAWLSKLVKHLQLTGMTSMLCRSWTLCLQMS